MSYMVGLRAIASGKRSSLSSISLPLPFRWPQSPSIKLSPASRLINTIEAKSHSVPAQRQHSLGQKDNSTTARREDTGTQRENSLGLAKEDWYKPSLTVRDIFERKAMPDWHAMNVDSENEVSHLRRSLHETNRRVEELEQKRRYGWQLHDEIKKRIQVVDEYLHLRLARKRVNREKQGREYRQKKEEQDKKDRDEIDEASRSAQEMKRKVLGRYWIIYTTPFGEVTWWCIGMAISFVFVDALRQRISGTANEPSKPAEKTSVPDEGGVAYGMPVETKQTLAPATYDAAKPSAKHQPAERGPAMCKADGTIHEDTKGDGTNRNRKAEERDVTRKVKAKATAGKPKDADNDTDAVVKKNATVRRKIKVDREPRTRVAPEKERDLCIVAKPEMLHTLKVEEANSKHRSWGRFLWKCE